MSCHVIPCHLTHRFSERPVIPEFVFDRSAGHILHENAKDLRKQNEDKTKTKIHEDAKDLRRGNEDKIKPKHHEDAKDLQRQNEAGI